MKEKLCQAIDERADAYCALSDEIWGYAETAFAENRSAEALAAFLEADGFQVTRGVAGIETAFTATYGEGGVHLGILGEYDALADLEQTSMSTEQSPPAGRPGHGCGHNLLGAGALAAACAIKAYLAEGHPGCVTYFGCPGEEGGSGKTFMARDGVFDGVDAALSWHPGSKTSVASSSSLANYQILYRFHGIAAHAAGQPHLGRSALDAVEMMNIGVQFLREHIPQAARIHYAITDTGGYSPNVVQAEASVLYLMRMPQVTDLAELYERVNDIARGAALMTGTSVESTFIKACSNTLTNRPLMEAMYTNMLAIPGPAYDEEETSFAEKLRGTFASATEGGAFDTAVDPLPETEGTGTGSTDVGDVSWICPTVYCYVVTAPRETPGHTWQMTSCGKASFAHKGMLYAAKVIAMTAMDLYEDETLLAHAKEELHKRTDGQYICPIPEGIKPRSISDVK
ncbi:MAG: amidohydrolase [Clostridiaceae bacterium]|nr:amidohydrolase [Clostridiaceae bacterium]